MSIDWKSEYEAEREKRLTAKGRIAALEARLADTTALWHERSGTCRLQAIRIVDLEALLREAREWIETDTEALEECHKPYDLNSPGDVEIAQEVDDRRTWLARTAAKTETEHG